MTLEMTTMEKFHPFFTISVLRSIRLVVTLDKKWQSMYSWVVETASTLRMVCVKGLCLWQTLYIHSFL